MQYKQFLLSFATTALLVTPFAIHADDAPELAGELLVAPAAGENAVVEGLRFNSLMVKHDTKTATLQVSAKNDTKKRIHTEVVASLMQRPSISPMARMVPMPTEIAQSKLALDLAPGETFTKTITVQLPRTVTEELAAWELTTLAIAKGNSTKTEEELALDVMQPLAPSFFASVRSLAPASVQAKVVAAK